MHAFLRLVLMKLALLCVQCALHSFYHHVSKPRCIFINYFATTPLLCPDNVTSGSSSFSMAGIGAVNDNVSVAAQHSQMCLFLVNQGKEAAASTGCQLQAFMNTNTVVCKGILCHFVLLYSFEPPPQSIKAFIIRLIEIFSPCYDFT